MAKQKVTLHDIADRIAEHLKRFENDPKINVPNPKYKTSPYWCTNAYSPTKSSRVYVTYISYQGRTALKRVEAEAYLQKLDDGFVGRHFEALSDRS